MADAWILDVDGAGDAFRVSEAIARVLGIAAPEFTGEQYELKLTDGDLAYAEDVDPERNGAYPVSVDVYGRSREGVARNARWLYDALADKTEWGLRLVDDGFVEVAERPLVHA